MYKDYDNYRTYENDDLSAGTTLKVEHTIIVNETDILNLISQPLEKIQAMRDNNVKKETAAFEKVRQSARDWEKKAAITRQFDRAIEYLKVPEVSHTSNKWVNDRDCYNHDCTDPVVIGEYRGFTMILSFDTLHMTHKLTLQNSRSYTIELGTDVFGNIQRIDNALTSIPSLKEKCEQKLTETKKQFEIAKVESKNEFPREAELNEKQKRLAELDALLNIDKKNKEVMDIPDETPQKECSYDMER